MVNQSLIQKLKKVNVSVDPEKTKARFHDLWKSSTNAQKNEILALADVVRASAYRVGNIGSVSAKLVLAMSDVLNVSPFYLTGESDAQGSFAQDDLYNFLQSRGYKKLLPELAAPPAAAKPKRAYTKRAGKASPAVAAPPVREEETAAPPHELTNEEVIILLRALMIRAKSSEEDKNTLLAIIRLLQ